MHGRSEGGGGCSVNIVCPKVHTHRRKRVTKATRARRGIMHTYMYIYELENTYHRHICGICVQHLRANSKTVRFKTMAER